MKRITLFVVFICLLAVTAAAAAETYKVAVDPNYPPFVYLDRDGDYAGLDIDIIKAIAADQDFDVEFVSVNFDLLLRNVAAGTYDIGLGAITKTPEREKMVAMSEPYYISGQVTVINKESPYLDSIVDLTKLTIGVKDGTVSADLAKSYKDAAVETYPNVDELFEALRNQEIDAALVDKSVSETLSDDDCLVQVGTPLTVEDLVIASDPSNVVLYQKIDRGLASIKKNGLLAALLLAAYEY